MHQVGEYRADLPQWLPLGPNKSELLRRSGAIGRGNGLQRVTLGPAPIEAGIDYVRCTMRKDHDNAATWYGRCIDLCKLVRDAGNTLKSASRLGYDGFACGPCFAGDRHTDYMLQVSGVWASQAFIRCYDPDLHYSRLDLQVTIRTDTYHREMAHVAAREAHRHNMSFPKSRRRKVRITREFGGGATVYIGTRTSDHFMRIYDKAAESDADEYENAWRYECELHNTHATETARYLSQRAGTIPAIITSTVARYMVKRGMSPQWSYGDEASAILPSKAPASDDERALAWLSSQVGPTVSRLVGRGYLAEVLAALKLDEPGILQVGSFPAERS